MFVCWTTRSTFSLVSSVIDYNTALDGIDLLEIGLVNACEMAFKIDEAMWRTIKSDCAVTRQELRAKESF